MVATDASTTPDQDAALQEALADRDHAKAELEAMRQELTSLHQDRGRLDVECMELQAKLDAVSYDNEEAERLRGQVQELEERLATTEATPSTPAPDADASGEADAADEATLTQEEVDRLLARNEELEAQVKDLEAHAQDAEAAVVEQEEEIQDLERRLQDAEAVAEKKGVKEQIARVVAKEQSKHTKEMDRLRKEHAAAIEDLKEEHGSRVAEIEAFRIGDRKRWEQEQEERFQAKERQIQDLEQAHQAALKENDTAHAKEVEDLERSLRQEGGRIAELKQEVQDLEDLVHRVERQKKAVIEQAAKDVAEAELNGKVRNKRSKTRAAAEAALFAVPHSKRGLRRAVAEDKLWKKDKKS